MNDSLQLNMFFPSELLSITSVDFDDSSIHIKMQSKTHSCKCPKCGQETETYHGTYLRQVQDLPILGKTARLHITAHEYVCNNRSCSKVTFVEDFDGFLSYYGRMTERCADFVCMLAMKTSCEGCARICRAMKLQISGDSVIRLLTKRYRLHPVAKCGSAIGVDDFAFKKRHTYGKIIVDEATHRPVAILDGRDGMTLKEWLKNNKHVKTVTRDRASAYSSAIQEILPDAMQIADALDLYKSRDASEKLFREDKTFLGNRTMRCQSNEALHAKIFIEFVALIIRNRIHFLLREQMLKAHQKENYMTVPAAVRELEKIEIVRQTDGEYYWDYAVTATQKSILKAFGLAEINVRKQAADINEDLRSCNTKEA